MSRQEMCETGDGSPVNFEPDTELGEINDIPELLKTYNELGLGRAIMLVSEDPVSKTPLRELGGYILPTPDELEHLIILRSGEMYFVGPRSDSPEDQTAYRLSHAPNAQEFHYTQSPKFFEEGTKGLSFFMEANLDSFNQRIRSSNKSGVDDKFIKKIEDAVDTALVMRRQRLHGFETSRNALLKKGINGPTFTPYEQQAPVPTSFASSNLEEEVLWEDTSGEDFCAIE